MTDNQTDQTAQVISDLKLHPGMLRMDPGCNYIKHFAVNKGVQGVLHIDGSNSLIYLVNPDDGREPYIVICGPEPSMMMTTKLHRDGEDWKKLDELVSSIDEEDYDDD